MVHEPVDLLFDSWYPTDFLSANLRHTVSAIFSHPAKEIRRRLQVSGDRTVALPQSMEIDRIDENSSSPILNLALDVVTEEAVNQNQTPHQELGYNAPLAITGPSYSGSLVPATSGIF